MDEETKEIEKPKRAKKKKPFKFKGLSAEEIAQVLEETKYKRSYPHSSYALLKYR